MLLFPPVWVVSLSSCLVWLSPKSFFGVGNETVGGEAVTGVTWKPTVRGGHALFIDSMEFEHEMFKLKLFTSFWQIWTLDVSSKRLLVKGCMQNVLDDGSTTAAWRFCFWDVSLYIYIYREREREIDIDREREGDIYIYIYMYIHTYMYRQREREREKEQCT